MIARYRNRAIRLLGISLLLLFLIPVAVVTMKRFRIPDALLVVAAILLGTFGVVFYIQGNIALAKAKGYDDGIVAAFIIATVLCTGGIFLMMPFVILFGLKDKTKTRRHSRGPEPEPTRRNPPAKLPPLRGDPAIQPTADRKPGGDEGGLTGQV